MTDEQKLQAFDTFTSYVSKRNISIMSKPEWEQLYFYCTAKCLFNGKSLISLSTQELYEIGRKLNLDFSKVSSLVKKCCRLESEENDGNTKDGYLKLIGQDTATIAEKLKSNLKTIVNDIKNLIPKSKNIQENESDLLERATDLINNSKMQESVGNFASIISKIYGVGTGDVGKAIFSFIKNQFVKPNDETLGRLVSI